MSTIRSQTEGAGSTFSLSICFFVVGEGPGQPPSSRRIFRCPHHVRLTPFEDACTHPRWMIRGMETRSVRSNRILSSPRFVGFVTPDETEESMSYPPGSTLGICIHGRSTARRPTIGLVREVQCRDWWQVEQTRSRHMNVKERRQCKVASPLQIGINTETTASRCTPSWTWIRQG